MHIHTQPCHLHLVKDEIGNRGNCSGNINFRSPASCQPPDCDFTVAWVDSGLWVNFSLTAAVGPSNTSVWAAVGFSGDTLMVCVCVGEGGERGGEECGVGKGAVSVLQLPKLIVKILEMRNLYKIFSQ